MAIAKKMWVLPEMIVLVRSNPEEAVLDVCKIGNADGPRPERPGWNHCKHGGLENGEPSNNVYCLEPQTS